MILSCCSSLAAPLLLSLRLLTALPSLADCHIPVIDVPLKSPYLSRPVTLIYDPIDCHRSPSLFLQSIRSLSTITNIRYLLLSLLAIINNIHHYCYCYCYYYYRSYCYCHYCPYHNSLLYFNNSHHYKKNSDYSQSVHRPANLLPVHRAGLIEWPLCRCAAVL